MPLTHTHETDVKFDCTRAGVQPKPLCALEHCMILLTHSFTPLLFVFYQLQAVARFSSTGDLCLFGGVGG